MARDDVTFPSGDGSCAAWLYRPEGAGGEVPCVVMANGFSLTRHDGLPAYAEAFAAAGVAVLVFDHRHLGDSPGEPRQRFRKALQEEDWRSAVAFARREPGIDASRIALWGFSFSGAHVVQTARRDRRIAAAMVLSPYLDGLARALATPPRLTAWILPRALLDLAGRHTTVNVTGQPGERAAMTLPGESDGFARSIPDGSPWRNEISPGLFASVVLHRPVVHARSVTCPLFVGRGERDISVSGAAVERLARRAPRAELHRYDVDHFEHLVDPHAGRIAADQVAFLRRHGLAGAVAKASEFG